jgi:2-polyprenyl-6-methoxyphenol hydroxylase-like FAD-dependent oxidoreductase
MGHTSERVLIVGGGIGGLAAAVALRRVGLAASVFERAPELNEIGAGISLWSNAVQALGRLGLAEAVVARGTVLDHALTLTAAGRLLSDVDLAGLAHRAGCVSACVHRAELQSVLATAVGPALRLGAACVEVAEESDGVTVRLADGGTERGTLLVGADGIHSVVRVHLHGPTESRRAGYVAYRGMARFDVPESPPDRSRLILGPGAQAGIFPCGPGRTYWFATAPATAVPPAGPAGDQKAEALERFRGWYALLPEVIAATEPAAVMRHDVLDLPPVWPWGRDRVTLLGDAAHATTPNLGQGACQALEDAVFLADSLRQHGPTPAGLRRYEEARRHRTERVVRLSWSMGKVLQWSNPFAVRLRNWMLASRFGRRQGMATVEELLAYKLPDLRPASQSEAMARG